MDESYRQVQSRLDVRNSYVPPRGTSMNSINYHQIVYMLVVLIRLRTEKANILLRVTHTVVHVEYRRTKGILDHYHHVEWMVILSIFLNKLA